jgi:peptidoglycan/xylan/chitin deacetylase (PgdA/CDA1 family)
MRRAARVPFAERGGTLRGLLDLATGRYPLFLFGGPMGRLLPVFHLHEVTAASFEPQLRFLADRGYRTVTSDAIARFVRDGRHPGAGTVALCFDDARASLWTVAAPLLRRYQFQAITYAIPGRIEPADAPRPTLDTDPVVADHATPGSPFVTWPELEALHASGTIDVQSHTYAHASMFCDAAIVGFVAPAYAARDPLDRPVISVAGEPVFLEPGSLGAPLFLQRSRMSDARRFIPRPDLTERCQSLAAVRGGPAFFERPDWTTELTRAAGPAGGTWESDEDRQRAIADELDRSRAVLADRLRGSSIRHLCFPWGVGGAIAREAARRVGYETAFSERLFGFRAVRRGDDPYRLMRLNGKFITRLPGRHAA